MNTCEAAKNFAKATDENRPVFEYVQSLPKETANAQTQTPNDLVEGNITKIFCCYSHLFNFVYTLYFYRRPSTQEYRSKYAKKGYTL